MFVEGHIVAAIFCTIATVGWAIQGLGNAFYFRLVRHLPLALIRQLTEHKSDLESSKGCWTHIREGEGSFKSPANEYLRLSFPRDFRPRPNLPPTALKPTLPEVDDYVLRLTDCYSYHLGLSYSCHNDDTDCLLRIYCCPEHAVSTIAPRPLPRLASTVAMTLRSKAFEDRICDQTKLSLDNCYGRYLSHTIFHANLRV